MTPISEILVKYRHGDNLDGLELATDMPSDKEIAFDFEEVVANVRMDTEYWDCPNCIKPTRSLNY